MSQKEIELFWIRCYLNPKNDYRIACIKRAYTDFARTLTNITEDKVKKYKLKEWMNNRIDSFFNKPIEDQEMFDKWHQDECLQIILKFKELLNYKIYYGQAQKWINMTLKYMFAAGEGRIPGSSTHYHFYHIPIDNIVIKKLCSEGKITKFKCAWSKIDDYDIYLNFQKQVRILYPGCIPMDIEFRLYNQS